MRDAKPPSRAPSESLAGSRSSAARLMRLSLVGTPEVERLTRLREFFRPLGIRYDAAPVGGEPIEIDLTVHGIPGIMLLAGRMQGARYRRIREYNDPAEDVGLVLNAGGAQHIRQRGHEVVLDDGDATLLSLTDPLEGTHRPPGTLRVLRLPLAQLAPRLSGGQDSFLRRIPRGAAALNLLTGYLDAAWQEWDQQRRGAKE